MPEIKWVGSPNHFDGREGLPIRFIVDHISEGTLGSMDNWFNNPASQASSNYSVGRNGEIHQYVLDEDGAWANGKVTRADNPVWIEFGEINPNLVSISIEHEGYSGEPLTEPQYQATLWLHKMLIAKYGIEPNGDHIIGHYRIDPVTRARCPGKAFPWERLLTDLTKVEPNPEQWKYDAVEKLAAAGVIIDPEGWKAKINEPIPVWAVCSMLARMLK